jgi:hypothetical protein
VLTVKVVDDMAARWQVGSETNVKMRVHQETCHLLFWAHTNSYELVRVRTSRKVEKLKWNLDPPQKKNKKKKKVQKLKS